MKRRVSKFLGLGVFIFLSPRVSHANGPIYYADQYCNTPGVLDQSCIQNAINAAPWGAEILVRPSTNAYLLSGSGSELILINKVITLECSGGTNPIYVSANVPNTTDVLHIAGVGTLQSPTNIEGAAVENCQFLPQSGTPARYGLFIDSNRAIINRLKVDHDTFGPFGSNAIYAQNPATASTFFGSTIEHNLLYQGIGMVNAGDSIEIQYNTIRGSDVGLDISSLYYVPLGGPVALLTVAYNDILTSGGCMHLGDNVNQAKVLSNRCENLAGGSASDNAEIDIDAGAANIGAGSFDPAGQMIEVAGNWISPVQSGINGIRVNDTLHADIHDNWVGRAPNAVDYVVTANATDTDIHGNDENPYGEADNLTITNQSTTTLYERYYNGSFSVVLGTVAPGASTPTYGALDHLQILPASVVTTPNQTISFHVLSYDSASHLLGVPSVAWSVSGGGSISGAGLLTAGASPAGGSSMVMAQSGNVSASAHVTVVSTATVAGVIISSPTILFADQYCTSPGVLDQSCIQNAITAAPIGAEVYVPPSGLYVLSGTGPQLILINKPITLECSGWTNQIVVAPSVPATTDVLRIGGSDPNSVIAIDGAVIKDCQILSQSGTPARNGLFIDGATANVTRLKLDHNYVGFLGGHAVVASNPTNSSRFSSAWIMNNAFSDGVVLTNAGSQITIDYNTIAGTGVGLDISILVGASGLNVDYDNITAHGGCMHLGGGVSQAQFLWNQCENQSGGSGPDNAEIDIDGALGNPTQNIELAGNRIAPVQAGVTGLRVNNAINTTIHDNWIARASASNVDYVVTANAVNTRIYNNEEVPYADPNSLTINDQSSSTMYERYFNGSLDAVTENIPPTPLAPTIAFTAATPANQYVIAVATPSVQIQYAVTDNETVSSFVDWNRSLAGYWNFDETSGLTAHDQSTYNNSGTLINAPAWTQGRMGNGLQFSETNASYVDVPNAPSLNITGAITVEGWFYPTAYPKSSDYAIQPLSKWNMSNGRDETVDANFALYFFGDFNGSDDNLNKKIAFFATVGGVWSQVTPFYTINSLNTWYHIVWTYDPLAGSVLYVNGVAQPTAPIALGNLGTNTGDLLIGSGFTGTIDEVKIWNRALSATEVLNSYGGPPSVVTQRYSNPPPPGTSYSYYAVAVDTAGNTAKTETRTLSTSATVPPLTASFTATPLSGSAPLLVQFDASGSSNLTGSTVTYSWNFGDGTQYTGLLSPIISHSFASPGVYISTLALTGSNNVTASTAATITVTASLPPNGVLDFNAPYNLTNVPNSAFFTGGPTQILNQDILITSVTTTVSNLAAQNALYSADGVLNMWRTSAPTYPQGGGYVNALLWHSLHANHPQDWIAGLDISQTPLYVPAGTSIIAVSGISGFSEEVAQQLNPDFKVFYKPYQPGTPRYRTLSFPYDTQLLKPDGTMAASPYQSTALSPLHVKGAFVFVAAAGTIQPCLHWLHADGSVNQTACFAPQVVDTSVNNYDTPPILNVDWTIPPGDILTATCDLTPAGGNNECDMGAIVEIPSWIKPNPENAFRDYGNIAPNALQIYCNEQPAQYVNSSPSYFCSAQDYQSCQGGGTFGFGSCCNASYAANLCEALYPEASCLATNTCAAPPAVFAGPDQTVTLPNFTVLQGTATDQGSPYWILSTTWSVISGPGPVIFSSTYTAIASASFSTPGTYVLELSATDSVLQSSSTVTVTVNPISVSLSSLNPAVITAGDPGFNLTINGANLESGCTAYWNGLALTTGFVNVSSMTAAVPSSFFVSVGTAAVQVINPDGGTSNSLSFNIVPPPQTPDLSGWPSFIPIDGILNLPVQPGASYQWAFTPETVTSASTVRAMATSSGSAASTLTQAPALSLASLALSPGRYSVQVIVINAAGKASNPAQATITLVTASNDLSVVRVYPNPFRSARGDISITFDQMPAGSTVKIFTVSARLVTTLSAPAGIVTWLLTNDSGDKVASGIYLYLITDGQGNRARGKFTVIR